ncbi:MAG: hypothetical protein WAL67_10550 [Candidatus Cybelea sp.]
MIWLKSAFAAASALWLSVFAASAASLPSAEGVQARFVEALGGADAITRPHSMTLKGFNLPSEPNGKRTRIPFVIYAADFKRLEVHSVPGKGDFSFGYDGKTAWALAPGAKAQIFTGSDAESIRRDADLYYFAHVPTYFRSMDVIGVESFYGHRCYRVRGINLWGNVNNQYYDVESGLLVGYRFHQWVGSAPEKAESVQIFDDYRRFDGLLIAMRETDYRDGRLIGVGRYESIRMNDVDPRVFELPSAIVALKRDKKP